MNKTTINNERKFIERTDMFIDKCDKLNYLSYKLKNSTLKRRYINNKQLFSLLCQVRDMFYDRLDANIRKEIHELEIKILYYDNAKRINYKGIKTIDENYFTKTSEMYRLMNKQIMLITTTWGTENNARTVIY